MNIALIKRYLNKLTKFIPTIFMILALTTASILYTLRQKLMNEIELKTNNIEAYQGVIAELNASNAVLRLDMATLSQSNDKLLQKIDSVSDLLKISNNKLKLAMSTSLKVEVSEKDTVLVKDSCEFKKQFNPNKLTVLDISLAKDTLSYSLKITNDVYLFVYTKRDWKNKDKKFFKRLTTFDWKKITYYRYEIVNSNDLIQVGQTRVIENTEAK